MNVYLYRRKGNAEYATCDQARYVELSQHKMFDTMICHTGPQPEPVGYFTFCEDKKKWMQGKPKGPEFLHLFTALYKDPSP